MNPHANSMFHQSFSAILELVTAHSSHHGIESGQCQLPVREGSPRSLSALEFFEHCCLGKVTLPGLMLKGAGSQGAMLLCNRSFSHPHLALAGLQQAVYPRSHAVSAMPSSPELTPILRPSPSGSSDLVLPVLPLLFPQGGGREAPRVLGAEVILDPVHHSGFWHSMLSTPSLL